MTLELHKQGGCGKRPGEVYGGGRGMLARKWLTEVQFEEQERMQTMTNNIARDLD